MNITTARSFVTTALLAGALAFVTSQAHAQTYLGKIGGDGGGAFREPCPAGQNLTGFELLTGDDVDAIRPVCVISYDATQISTPAVHLDRADPTWHGGTGGGHFNQLLCPANTPVVLGISLYAMGEDTIIVNSIGVSCGRAIDGPQPMPLSESVSFSGAEGKPKGGLFTGADPLPHRDGQESCPAGQVAVGIHGSSGIWLDAFGLICDRARLAPRTDGRTVVGSIGRVGVPSGYVQTGSVCDSARAARARNSPAAADLEAQCRKAGGDATFHFPAPAPAPPATPAPPEDIATLNGMAARGRILITSDPLLKTLHDAEPAGSNRLGFEVGLAIAEGQTGQGPGKDAFRQKLPLGYAQDAFQRAVDFSIDHNANEPIFARGVLVMAGNAPAAAARTALPPNNQRLGFTIAAGLFGSTKNGGLGSTSRGPSSNHIHDLLSPTTRLGYEAALAFFKIP